MQLPLHRAAFPLTALNASHLCTAYAHFAQAHQVMVSSPILLASVHIVSEPSRKAACGLHHQQPHVSNVIAAQLLRAACSCPQPHARRISSSRSHSAWAHQVMVLSASLDSRRAHRVCMHSQKLHAAHAAGSHTSRTCLQLPLHQAAFPLAALYASIPCVAHARLSSGPSSDGAEPLS